MALEQRVSSLEGAYEHLATKEGLADVRGELANVRGELKADIADLRSELYRVEGRLIKWMVGLQLGTVVTAVAIATFIVKLVGD